jgi:hypothetical protein
MKRRDFFYSILLSFLWHFFWIAGINTYIIKDKFKVVSYPKISFIGSILSESKSLRFQQRKVERFSKFFWKDLFNVKEKVNPKLVFAKTNYFPSYKIASLDIHLKLNLSEINIHPFSKKIEKIPSNIQFKIDSRGNILFLKGMKLTGNMKEDLRKWFLFKSINYYLK